MVKPRECLMGMRWRPVNVNVIKANWHDETTSLGRAVVREVAAPIDMDPVARCLVTWGVIARSALFRVSRDGIRIYPQTTQTPGLDVLKNAVSGAETDEIGEGFECILLVSGFQALRAGDVVEAYRVEKE